MPHYTIATEDRKEETQKRLNKNKTIKIIQVIHQRKETNAIRTIRHTLVRNSQVRETPSRPLFLCIEAPIFSSSRTGRTSTKAPRKMASSKIPLGAKNNKKHYMHLGKKVWPTYPPTMALLTFASNSLGLSLRTAAASWFRGSSWFGCCMHRKECRNS